LVLGCGRTELFGSRKHCAPTDTVCQSMLPDGGAGNTGVGGNGVGGNGVGGNGVGGNGVGGNGVGGNGVGGNGVGGNGVGGNGGAGAGGTGGMMTCQAMHESCTNGKDDNCNGAIDCQDTTCQGDIVCSKPGQEVCNNGLDDDDDKLVDCADPDCKNNRVCIPTMGTEICNNGIDDNFDKLTDCGDPQCTKFPGCLTVACSSDVALGVLPAHGGRLATVVETVSATRSFATCAPPGGHARVIRFDLKESADVRMDLQQSGAHVVGLFRAGANQACDRNPVTCLNAADKPTGTQTYPALAAGTYWLIVESFPNTPGKASVTLSTGTMTSPEQCANGKDDDGNGLVDCQDLACRAATNCTQFECVPDAALGALIIGADAKSVRIDLTKAPSRYFPPCATNVPGGDAVVSFTLPETSGVEISFSQTGRTIFALYKQPQPGFACDDGDSYGSCSFEDTRSGAVAYVQQGAGKYLLIFKAESVADVGVLNLRISAFGNRKVEACANEVDDDGDGLVDCDDPDCTGIGMCGTPSCMPDVDLGPVGVGQTRSTMLDTTAANDFNPTGCGRGDGKERVVRFTVDTPMAVGIDCKDGGSHVMRLFQQLAALDKCNEHSQSACADPATLPFGCGFSIPGIQPGTYNLIVESFQAGSEGGMFLQITGVREIVREICDNGIDDDLDGATDCMDRKCVTSAICERFACRADDKLGTLPLDGTFAQTIVRTSTAGDDQTQTTCVSSGGGQDGDLDFTLSARADLTLQWAQNGNHVFQLYSDDGSFLSCEAGTSFGCFPTNGVATGTKVISSLPMGRYHLVVDADHVGAEGGVAVQLSAKPAP
jgi:hypothetical protein